MSSSESSSIAAGAVQPDRSLAAVQARLLENFMRAAPFQPATNLWRAIEVPVLAESLPRLGRGLDIGCGDGALTKILIDLARGQWQLVGVDPDPRETAQAVASGIYERVHTAPADRIPEPDAAFDFAFANSVLEHIDNLPSCLAEVARCLKPGGLLAATVPSVHFHNLLGARRQGAKREAYLRDIDRRLAHVQYWSPQRWSEEFERAGFEPATVTGYLSGRQTRRWERLSNCTGGLLYRLKRGRQRPIEIQRGLGLRRGMFRPLGFLSGTLARVISRGVLGDAPSSPDQAGCHLVLTRKR